MRIALALVAVSLLSGCFAHHPRHKTEYERQIDGPVDWSVVKRSEASWKAYQRSKFGRACRFRYTAECMLKGY